MNLSTADDETESIAIEDRERIPSWQDPRVISSYKRRRVEDFVIKILTTTSLVLVLYPLADILYRFAYRGLQSISLPALTQVARDGGLASNIAGTFLVAGLSTVIAVPIGVLGGIYLAEFSGRSRYAELVRFVSDVMAGVPSIVLGYVGFLLFVLYFGWGLSALAGGVTLAFLMLPYILRTTELSIRKVPLSIREAAAALGSTKAQLVNRLTFKLALPGILTGILLSISIAMGETAPLLWTAGTSQSYPCGLIGCPGGVGYLTRIFYDFLLNPNPTAEVQNLAYLSAFLLMSFAIGINIVARFGLRRISKI